MPEFLTRKYAGIPGWAIGGAAVLAGLLFFYFRGRSQSQAAAAQGQPYGSAVNNPAASSIPYVPSVNIIGAGLPGSSASTGSTAPVSTGGNVPRPVWQNGTPISPYVWKSTGINGPSNSNITPGSSGDPASNPPAYPGYGPYSWQWAPVPQGSDPSGQPWTDASYARALLGGGGGGGQGGWGYAGQPNPAGMFGWTTGWSSPNAGVSRVSALIPTGGGGGEGGGRTGTAMSGGINSTGASRMRRRTLPRRRQLAVR
jgi:hypothetical protein